MPNILQKIKNPTAKPQNIVLAVVYIAVFAALLAYPLYWHFFLRIN